MRWVEELTVSGSGPPWLSMGVARAEAFLLPADADTPAQLGERARLLAERPAEVVGELPGALVDDAVDEVTGGEGLAALATRVPDDVCVLADLGDGVFRLAAAVLCFPSHWRLADKLGQPTTAIHAPVPYYEVELAGRVDAFLARLRPGQVAARRNWTVHERPDLFAPEPPPGPLGVEPDDRWLRSERQALTRLPRSGAVAFSIRTQQVRLGEVKRHHPDVAARLAARLAAEPPAIRAYRGYDGDELATYLRG